MPASDLVPASERDLYWEWVRAEIDVPEGSPRQSDRQRHGLPPRVVALLERGDRTALDEPDWDKIRRAFRTLRGRYLDPLLDSGTRWYYGRLSVAEFAEVSIPNLTISFVPLAPSRRFEQFVRALDAGGKTPKDTFYKVYRHMRPIFDPGRVRGCPVLIAERVEGPYVLAEGATRSCILVSRRHHGEAVPRSFPVLVGVTSRAREWTWW